MSEKFDHVIRVGQRGWFRPRYVREFLLAAELMDLHYRVSVHRSWTQWFIQIGHVSDDQFLAIQKLAGQGKTDDEFLKELGIQAH